MPRTKIHSKNLKRAITQKLNETELWLLHTAIHLNAIYLYVKFKEFLLCAGRIPRTELSQVGILTLHDKPEFLLCAKQF